MTMRKFNFGGDSKDVIVLPDAGVSFAKEITGVPVPADVLRLRNTWKLAADGKGRELLGDEDCELCAQMRLLEEKEKTPRRSSITSTRWGTCPRPLHVPGLQIPCREHTVQLLALLGRDC